MLSPSYLGMVLVTDCNWVRDPTSLKVKGRMIGRTCFMFENIGVVIDAGLPHLDELKTMDTTQLTPEYVFSTSYL